jgi:ferredoxin
MFKIIHNKEKCIGCGKCARISENWRIGRCKKAEPVKTEIKNLGKEKIVSILCPVKCIRIEEI